MKTTLISYIDNLLFSVLRVNQSIKKIFLKVLKKMFLSFERWGVIIFSNFRNKFYPRWCKNIRHLLKRLTVIYEIFRKVEYLAYEHH